MPNLIKYAVCLLIAGVTGAIAIVLVSQREFDRALVAGLAAYFFNRFADFFNADDPQ